MLAMSAIPLMGSVGVAIDFTRASATRTAFQAALDSTALMLSKTAATQSGAELQTAATNYFNALFTQTGASNVAITADYTSAGGSKVMLNGTATVNTNFLGVLGYNQLNITASSTSTWGNTRLRVALVLDNTGSMSSSNKMTALKTASQNLLTQLKNAAVNDDDVYVSIVPFSKDVNVGVRQLQQVLAALGSVECRERDLQQFQLSQRKAVACRTARPGRPPTTAPGTAASPIATRISTLPTTRRSPAPRCIRPNSIHPARCR